jgi:hypothetical protein
LKGEPAATEPATNGAEPLPAPAVADDSSRAALPAPEPPPAEPVEPNGKTAIGPRLPEDPGLYAILGLDPSVSDVVVQTTYRRLAARLLSSGANDNARLRQLNVAYEVLGNPVRRAEYDRARTAHLLAPGPPAAIPAGMKGGARVTRRRRPRHAVQPRYAGLGDVFVVLVVVALAVVAGALIIPRLSINLSALNALSSVIPGQGGARRAIDATVTPATVTARAPTPTIRPGLADRFAGSTVAVSSAAPAQNTPESILIRLRRDGQPAANLDVWATVEYRTTAERWPGTGSVKTDASGAATITFNVGQATPGFPVQVHVVAQVDDEQLSWSTSFTPR